MIWILIAPSAALFAFHCVASYLTIRRSSVTLNSPVTKSPSMQDTEQAVPVRQHLYLFVLLSDISLVRFSENHLLLTAIVLDTESFSSTLRYMM